MLHAGCDKSLPGMLMAAARLDLSSVFLYAGSTLPGNVDGKDVTIIDAFEAVGACMKGLITRDEVDRIERAICPGEGRCGGMYNRQHDGLRGRGAGMKPARLGRPAGPRPPPRRLRQEVGRGRRRAAPQGHHRARHHDARGLRERHHRVMALGGSTNAVLHLLAIAREAGVPLTLDDFSRVGDKVPHLATSSRSAATS